jgi:5-(carboxyamino)imidazole ribonucleotide synthase
MRSEQAATRGTLPLLPGPTEPGLMTTLGVVGGGQLGRMFAQAAQRLGYSVAVLDPEAHGPASQVAPGSIVADYADLSAVQALGQRAQAFTTEFESVPAATMAALSEHGPVSPSAGALAVCQHRGREKALFDSVGVPCAPYALIDSPASLAAAQQKSLFPGILKTATLGYDGKGQREVAQAADLPGAWQTLNGQPVVLERRMPLALEFSLIVARGHDGHMVSLPAQQNLHRGGILAVTQVPAPDVSPGVAAKACAHVEALAAAMDYVGVLCVEFFVLTDGRLLANEMAPRPHNSGHASIDACDVSQFDLQVRTLAGLPLTQPRQHSVAVMLNLLGDLWFVAGAALPREPSWAAVLALPGVHLHLYGKQQARKGRKMGHVTITAADPARAKAVALQVAHALGLPVWP